MTAIQTMVDQLARAISLLKGGGEAGEFLRRVDAARPALGSNAARQRQTARCGAVRDHRGDRHGGPTRRLPAPTGAAGVAAFQRGEWSVASARSSRRRVRTNPRYAGAHYMVGQCQEKLGPGRRGDQGVPRGESARCPSNAQYALAPCPRSCSLADRLPARGTGGPGSDATRCAQGPTRRRRCSPSRSQVELALGNPDAARRAGAPGDRRLDTESAEAFAVLGMALARAAATARLSGRTGGLGARGDPAVGRNAVATGARVGAHGARRCAEAPSGPRSPRSRPRWRSGGGMRRAPSWRVRPCSAPATSTAPLGGSRDRSRRSARDLLPGTVPPGQEQARPGRDAFPPGAREGPRREAASGTSTPRSGFVLDLQKRYRRRRAGLRGRRQRRQGRGDERQAGTSAQNQGRRGGEAARGAAAPAAGVPKLTQQEALPRPPPRRARSSFCLRAPSGAQRGRGRHRAGRPGRRRAGMTGEDAGTRWKAGGRRAQRERQHRRDRRRRPGRPARRGRSRTTR